LLLLRAISKTLEFAQAYRKTCHSLTGDDLMTRFL